MDATYNSISHSTHELVKDSKKLFNITILTWTQKKKRIYTVSILMTLHLINFIMIRGNPSDLFNF
jgi:hypothetical protein